MTPNGETKIYGIIGNPVKHSFSPAMHTKAFEAIGKNAVYLPFPCAPDKLKRHLDNLWELGVKGFNVTVPYKEAVIPLLSTIDSLAKAIGSVNTVIRTEKGWEGYTTDGSGFIRSIGETKWSLQDQKVCMLGAGGSAKSIGYQLAGGNELQSLTILNRTSQKAEDLKGQITKDLFPFLKSKGIPAPEILIADQLGQEYDLLINTTSVGMTSDDSPAPLELLKRCAKVVDIIYNPTETRLLKTAKDLGKPTLNGLGMLLYQGVEAFEIWTGATAPVEVMKDSLYSTLGIDPE